jgi:DNA sulfur modification protein DndC
VPKIYREIMGQDLAWVRDEVPGFSAEERSILNTICARHEIPSVLVAKLLDLERAHHGMSRRAAMQAKIAAVFEEDWRTADEVLGSVLELPS